VKHSRYKGFQVIKDRLTYGRKAPLQTSKRERKHGRDLECGFGVYLRFLVQKIDLSFEECSYV
jgi:hypothetical protein